jgi:hypothetical protein
MNLKQAWLKRQPGRCEENVMMKDDTRKLLMPTSMRPARQLLSVLLLSGLVACGAESAREAALAEEEAARIAAEQMAARVEANEQRERAAERERERIAQAEQRERQRRERELARQQAEARAEAERRGREEAERREQERLAAIAAAEAEREDKLERIVLLEAQIATIQAETGADEERTVVLKQAIQAAEELLEALADEAAKYESTDETGNTLDPLAKDMLAELEARKNELVERARAQ